MKAAAELSSKDDDTLAFDRSQMEEYLREVADTNPIHQGELAVLPEMEKCCIPDRVSDCGWYSSDLRIRSRLDETRDRTAVGRGYRTIRHSVYPA